MAFTKMLQNLQDPLFQKQVCISLQATPKPVITPSFLRAYQTYQIATTQRLQGS